jgi:hypothetical protein
MAGGVVKETDGARAMGCDESRARMTALMIAVFVLEGGSLLALSRTVVVGVAWHIGNNKIPKQYRTGLGLVSAMSVVHDQQRRGHTPFPCTQPLPPDAGSCNRLRPSAGQCQAASRPHATWLTWQAGSRPLSVSFDPPRPFIRAGVELEWDEKTCTCSSGLVRMAARGIAACASRHLRIQVLLSHTAVLDWARANGCPEE